MRAKPPARHPHRRTSRNSRSTNRGIPSPSRSDAARARKVSKWSCTIPYKMVDMGSRASYALEGCATRRPQAPRVPITRDRSIRRGSCDQVQRGREADNRGCRRVQIESTAGAITGRLFGVNARTSRTTRRATTVTVLSPTAVARRAGRRATWHDTNSTCRARACAGWPAIMRTHPPHGAQAVSGAAQPPKGTLLRLSDSER